MKIVLLTISTSNAFIFPTVYFFFPETRRRSLEEMDIIFKKTNSIFDCVKVAANEPHRYDEKGRLKPEYINTGEPRKGSLQSDGEAHHINDVDLESANEKPSGTMGTSAHYD